MTASGNETMSESNTSPVDQPKPHRSQKKLGMLGKWGAILTATAGLLVALVWLAISTKESRAGVAAYTRLTAAVNAQDIESVKSMCTQRFIQTHTFQTAPEGGLVGFPRFIHKNFQVWREDDAVWVCPTNRVGPVYQFLKEDDQWKYDGLIGLLRSGHQILVLPEESRQSGEDENLIVP